MSWNTVRFQDSIAPLIIAQSYQACAPSCSYSSPRCTGSHNQSYRQLCCRPGKSRTPEPLIHTLPMGEAGRSAKDERGDKGLAGPGGSCNMQSPHWRTPGKKNILDHNKPGGLEKTNGPLLFLDSGWGTRGSGAAPPAPQRRPSGCTFTVYHPASVSSKSI